MKFKIILFSLLLVLMGGCKSAGAIGDGLTAAWAFGFIDHKEEKKLENSNEL